MSRMIKLLFLQPAKMTSAPSGFTRKNATVAEHERVDLLTMHTQRFDRRGSCANEITHCFMAFVRNPHRCQLTRPKHLGERNRVTTVGLNPIAWLSRNERRRHDRARKPHRNDESMQTIARWACFIAKMRLRMLNRDAFDQATHALDG